MARSTKFTHYYPQSGFPFKTDHPLSIASQYPPPGDALSISVELPPGNSHQYPVLGILTSTQFKILNQSRYVKVLNYFHISFFKLLAIFKTCSKSKTCNTCMFKLITVITIRKGGSWYNIYSFVAPGLTLFVGLMLFNL